MGENEAPVLVRLESVSEGSKRLTLPAKIGRRVGNKVVPKEDNGIYESQVLSRNHAEIFFENGKVMLKDLGSSNGTYLDDQKVENPVELKDGSQIDFGVVVYNEENGEVLHDKVTATVRFEQIEKPKLEVEELPEVFVKSLPTKTFEDNQEILESVFQLITDELRKQKEIEYELLELQKAIQQGKISFEPPVNNDTIKLQRELRILKKKNGELEQQVNQEKQKQEDKDQMKKENERLASRVSELEKENKELQEKSAKESEKNQEEQKLLNEKIESLELQKELKQKESKPVDELTHKVKTLEDLISQLREEISEKNLFIRKLEWRGDKRRSEGKINVPWTPNPPKSSKIRDIQKIFESE